MNRRESIVVAGTLGLAAAPPLAAAQARPNLPRVGVLSFGAAPTGADEVIE